MNDLRILCLAVATFIGCASQRPTIPTVAIAQISPVEILRAAPQSGVPVEYRLDVTNPLDHPVTLTSVEIETVGMAGAYKMKRVRHTFSREIPPRTTDTIALRAWVQPLQETMAGRITSPVMVRGIARFESMGRAIQSAFTARLQ
jgi:hypothetical protein